uniref:ATP synthase complex subunit 8 n=1 Tax=Limnia unguicornis TaxID=1226590 RepID=A0A7D6W4K9_9MUSC|nr:ATP synthase F0 subunit 8 [Limnia unguicornis]
MPQMAPISWLILFIVFSMVFFLFNSLNYFSVVLFPHTSSSLKTLHLLPMNWKW